MKIEKYINYLLFVLMLIAGISCSIYTEPEESAEALIDVGWEKFQDGDYEEALSKFANAIFTDDDIALAYQGRGWCYLILSNATLAAEDFNMAITKGDNSLDPLAGLAAAYLAQQEYMLAISKAKAVLEGNPNYFFEYEPQINYLDMRIILAMAYFHEGRLDEAQEQVNFLYPDNGLDPDDSETWLGYISYAEALMSVIDLLDIDYLM